MTDGELVPLLQLMQSKGVGPRTVARVLDRLAEEGLSLAELVELPAEDLAARIDVSEDQAAAIRENRDAAARLAESLQQNNVRVIARNSDTYPDRLRSVLGDKAPPVLFVAGSAELLHRRAVGFCGARDASEEALRCADEIARALAQQGLLVVSGHAPGVDETAHRAALMAGGQTAMVLPEGILQFRPRPSLAEHLAEDQFVVVSEFPPKLPWSVANAMQRNRTICGLVHALIVIEAGSSGGTWEAGQTALSLRVPLFVLEYPNPAPSADGNALLVKKGGRPLPCRMGESPDLTSLLQALELPGPEPVSHQSGLFDRLS